MRVALYWAPELTDPLHALGSRWLGRDAETGAILAQPAIPGVDMAALTTGPRRYGLHATLKPPFRPQEPWPELRAAAAALATRTLPFLLPPLRVTLLDGFLALREAEACPALQVLADACVEALDAFRSPSSAAELACRQRHDLNPAQQALLLRWGYPYVKDQWRFHVTLTRRLAPAERNVMRAAAEQFLGREAARQRPVRELCLFTQATLEAPFRIAERLPLPG